MPQPGKWLFLPEQEAGDNPQDPHYNDRSAHVIPVPSCWIPLQACLEDGASLQELALSYSLWYSVKKKYKLNVNFFHNTILKLRLILNSLTLSYIYLHIRLERDIHNGCVF